MLLIVGGLIPVLLASLVWMWLNVVGARHGVLQTPPARQPLRWSPESRWEALTEEIARRGTRGRPQPSDAATRRRHLASVLRADARR